MVLNTEQEMPASARVANMPAKEPVTPEPNCPRTYTIPAARKTGRRPCVSENGARIMGATAKQRVKMVMPA